jgi:CheY-like chemotaxis protein
MQKKVILLVEDDELDIISVRRSLSKLDIEFDVHLAFNGIDALEMLRGKVGHSGMHALPDIILLDINMPKMNGIEFLRELRAEERFSQIKVIVMTTSAEQHDRTETDRLGISGYLIKPMGYYNNDKRVDSMDGFVQFYIGKILRETLTRF